MVVNSRTALPGHHAPCDKPAGGLSSSEEFRALTKNRIGGWHGSPFFLGAWHRKCGLLSVHSRWFKKSVPEQPGCAVFKLHLQGVSMVVVAESPYVRIAARRKELVAHPLYAEIADLAGVRRFMKHHVFAVWDFMCLLKALQRAVTCVDVPWMPTPNPKVRRFVNEIVLGEESDEDGEKGYLSHYELYCKAMEQCGADSKPVQVFLQELDRSKDIEGALEKAAVPEFVAQFVRTTLEIALSGKAALRRCSLFLWSRGCDSGYVSRCLEQAAERSIAPPGALHLLHRSAY
jgi:hypothetical protein